MPCLVGCLALIAPRITIVLVVVFSDWLGTAYDTWIVPFLGFLFMPMTTLAFAWGRHHDTRSIEGLELVVLVIAVLIDLGLVGGGGASYRKRNARMKKVRCR